jgi:putative transposase
MIPPSRHGGRRRSVDVREVLNAIFYVLSTGCQWKAMPKDLPPKSTAHCYSCCGTGTAGWIASTTRFMSRHVMQPDARQVPRLQSSSPKAATQRKKGLCTWPQGFDAGKKVTGRKRHILVDTLGLLLGVSVHAADIQDRDGTHDLLRQARRRFPFIELTAAIRAPKWQRLLPRRDARRSRSSSDPISIALSSCPSGGLSKEHSPG